MPTEGFIGMAIGIATKLCVRIHLYPEALCPEVSCHTTATKGAALPSP